MQSRHGGLKVGKILAFFFLYVVSTTVLSIYAGKQIPKISLKYPTIPQNTPHFIEHEQWFYLAFSSFVVSVVGCMRIQLSREIHLVQLKLVIMSRQCALSPVNMNTFPYLEKKKKEIELLYSLSFFHCPVAFMQCICILKCSAAHRAVPVSSHVIMYPFHLAPSACGRYRGLCKLDAVEFRHLHATRRRVVLQQFTSAPMAWV